MISTDCRKCAKSDICYADDVKPCIGYEPKKQTNADRIRGMSDEELAEFLNGHNFCAHNFDCEKGRRPCRECNLDWMKQEVTE